MATPAEYAQVDPALAIASLFRPVTRGRRPRALELVTEHDGLTLTWRSFEYLDSRDQSVLYACAALAALEEGGHLTSESDGKIGQKLWMDLEPEQRARVDQAIAFDTTYYQILRAAGLDTNRAGYARLKEILSRLSDVSIRAQKDGYDWKMRLLSYAARPDGRISIAMNPRMAAALNGHNVHISLSERRQLEHDVSQIAHGWLSAWNRAGRTQRISLDKLAARVWGVDSQNSNTKRSRRYRIAEALREISELHGWQIQIDGTGSRSIAQVRRQKLIGNE